MTKERYFVMRDETLFHPASITPIYPLVTPLSLGLVRVYRLPMEEDKIYIVDAGFNDLFIYETASAGHRDKFFWKLNLQENPPLQAKYIQKEFDISIEVPDIPSFDPKFDNRGGWITMKYNVRIRLRVDADKIGQVHQAVNPLTTIQNVARRTVRQHLPFVAYEEALIAACEEIIKTQMLQDEAMQATGLDLILVDVEGIEGSKLLNESLQQSFGRLSEARDKRDIALEFKSLDDKTFTTVLEYASPEKALELRARAKDQMLEALLASGKSLQEVATLSGWAARNLDERDGLAAEVSMEALKRIEEWPIPDIPISKSHTERLQWERELLQERIPVQVNPSVGASDIFVINMETGDELKITWWSPDLPPEVKINGMDRGGDYRILRAGVFEYSRVSTWDIYWETRRVLGVAEV